MRGEIRSPVCKGQARDLYLYLFTTDPTRKTYDKPQEAFWSSPVVWVTEVATTALSLGKWLLRYPVPNNDQKTTVNLMGLIFNQLLSDPFASIACGKNT